MSRREGYRVALILPRASLVPKQLCTIDDYTQYCVDRVDIALKMEQWSAQASAARLAHFSIYNATSTLATLYKNLNCIHHSPQTMNLRGEHNFFKHIASRCIMDDQCPGFKFRFVFFPLQMLRFSALSG